MAESLFLQEEGDTPKNRIWSFMIVHAEYDYSMKDIARFSGVGYTTLKAMWKGLTRKCIVRNTRLVGKAKMYQLNFNNPVVKKFVDYYWATVEGAVKRKNGDKSCDTSYTGSSISMPVSARNL